WDSSVEALDWPRLRDNKTKEIERLNGIYGNLLSNAGVELINGHARIVDANTVEVDGVKYRAKNILIAVGGWPFIPDIPGRELAISSNEVFYLDTLPKHAVVVGGGYIATEFAGILHGLGVEVEQIYRRDLFLRGFDTEIREHLAEEMTAKGVKLRFNENVTAITEQNGQYLLSLENGESLLTDKVLYATGRKPLLDGLGLENTKVSLNDKGYIAVDEGFQTNEPSIYAVGDVTGGMELTPVALAEGMNLAKRLFKGDKTLLDYNYIPTAIFSQPNLATVGLSEEDARERYGDIAVYTSRFTHLKHTISGNKTKTFLKLVVDKASDKVVGAHMMGDDAGEIIQGLAVAIKAGATKADFDSTIGIHPTVAEEFVTMRDASR
ncbi:MAG: glutathione reductase (NADPH), partial [Zhongshania sp.]